MASHAQIPQNNKFAIPLQYLKKQLSDEVGFLYTDKHESSLQINSMILMGMVRRSQISQNRKFAMSLQYLKKEVKYEVDFLHTEKHQSFVKVYFNTLSIKVSCKVDIIIIKGTATDMRYFARSKLSRSFVQKKNFSLIQQVVFKLGYVFCQER